MISARRSSASTAFTTDRTDRGSCVRSSSSRCTTPTIRRTPPKPRQAAIFPANAPVWDQKKAEVAGDGTRENLYPACLDPNLVPPDQIAAGQAARDLPPICPPAFLRAATGDLDRRANQCSADQHVFAGNVQVWELRGAIATGMSVFSYLERRLATRAWRSCRRTTISASSSPDAAPGRSRAAPLTLRVCRIRYPIIGGSPPKIEARAAPRRRGAPARAGHQHPPGDGPIRAAADAPVGVRATRTGIARRREQGCGRRCDLSCALAQTEDSDENENTDHRSGLSGCGGALRPARRRPS